MEKKKETKVQRKTEVENNGQPNLNPLDLSVNAVLDITPRKIGSMLFKAVSGVYHVVAQTEAKALRKEILELKTAIEKNKS